MSHEISQTTAQEMTAVFRSNKETILDRNYQNQGILPICETFDKTELETLLSHPECEKLRIYYGMDENLKVHAILVGVNASDEDILPNDPNSENGEIMERSTRCPVDCPPESPLNS